MKLGVRNKTGSDVGEIEVRNDVFDVPDRHALVHQVMVGHLANKRLGTAKTKTRAEVSGGGAKPRPQKHTGRSRQGSIRSPIWVGGGRAFGPSPRSYRKQTPKKMRRQAMLCVLSNKVRNGDLVVIEDLDLDQGRTREVIGILDLLGLDDSTLIVTEEPNRNVVQGARNIGKVKTLPVKVLNTLDMLNSKNLLITVEAVRKAEETWGGIYHG